MNTVRMAWNKQYHADILWNKQIYADILWSKPLYVDLKKTSNIMLAFNKISNTVKPLLRGHPDKRPTPFERPHDYENLNQHVLISTPDERPPLLKGHISGTNVEASQEGFHCTCIMLIYYERSYNFMKANFIADWFMI